jgi:hypothetical protein
MTMKIWILVLGWLVNAAIAGAEPLDAAAIGKAAGVDAKAMPDGVVRVAWSRSDVAVTVDGVRLDPAAGLGSWAAFQPVDRGAIAMGDTVVFEDEITPALDAALAAGLEVTALHNHFAFDRPRVFFMHLGGHGEAVALAKGVRSVWDAIRAVRKAHPQPGDHFPGESASAGSLDAAALGGILGHEAERAGAVVKVTIPRGATMHGVAIGGSLGVTTWAAFSGSDARASVDGDFVMASAEVQPVLRALRGAGIHVVALHNHMLDEDPRLFFLHYWGKGEAAGLARGVRAALDAQSAAPVTR